MKVCARCHIEKEDSEFWKQDKNKDGLFSYCYQCCREKHMEYRRKKGILPMQRRPPEELPEFKVCTKCKIEKPKSEFRIREEKKEGVSYYYLSPPCKECEVKQAKENYEKHKNDPDFKQKNRERTARYVNSNLEQINARRKLPDYKKKHAEWALKRYYRKKDEINAKQREKRKTSKYKAYMKAYRKKRKDIIYEQEVITKRRYHEKNKNAVTDRYVINLLRSQGFGTSAELAKNKELIELKRAEILLARIKEKVRKEPIGETKKCTMCLKEKDLSEFYLNKNGIRVARCRDCNSLKCKEYREKQKAA